MIFLLSASSGCHTAVMPSPTKEAKRKSKDASEKSPKKSKHASVATSSSTRKAGEAILSIDAAKFGERSQAGAAFASFADFAPAPSTSFNLYRAEGIPDESGYRDDDDDERLLLAGETDTMAYVGTNFEFGSSAENRGYTGEYMVGIYDPSSSTVTLKALPAFQVSRSIKANSSLSSISSTKKFADYQAMTSARRDLGEAFGNRKQKNNAKNQDKMKVDTHNMDVILDDFTSGIETSLASLPSLEEVMASSTATRPMPPANLDAKHPSEAYKLSDLISTSVFNALPVQALIDNASDVEGLKELLPTTKPFPAWILSRLVDNAQRASYDDGAKATQHTTFSDDDDSDTDQKVAMPALGATENKEDAITKVRIAYYITLLYYVHSRPQLVGKKGRLIELLKLDGLDSAKQIVNSIYNTFTETPSGSSRAVMSAFHQTKMLAYMCALALHLDNFSVSHSQMARDCNIAPAHLREIFRSLGCTSSSTGGEKRMALKTPFILPQPRKGKAAPRR